MSFILDCTTGEQALISLCDGFSCTSSELHETLLSLDLDILYDSAFGRMVVSPDDYLYQYVVERLGEHAIHSEIIWFHCTRTHPEQNFSNGILPLNESIESVWQMILQLAPNNTVRERLNDWGQHGVPNGPYQLRTNNAEHWGPYGILVKEVALHADELSQHDYLKTPELIEDICNAYMKEYGENIFNHYFNTLKPKIITFVSNRCRYYGYIRAALGYAYTTVRGLPPNYLAVASIDCKGVPVTPEQIVRIETLQ